MKILGSISFTKATSMLAVCAALNSLYGYQTGTAAKGNGVAEKCYKATPQICEIEAEVHRLVNVERVKRGLPALKHHYRVSFVSRDWSKAQAWMGDLSHEGFPHRRMQLYKRTFHKEDVFMARENCTMAYLPAKISPEMGNKMAADMVNRWMNSPGHRANILAREVTWQGTGVYFSKEQYYATQIFGYDEKPPKWWPLRRGP
jgi:uncharacterized protein YkwD